MTPKTSSPRTSNSSAKSWSAARKKALLARFRSVPFPNWLGLKVKVLAAGSALLTMPITRRHTQYQGIAHGGALASLADTAATFAALTILPDGMDVVTIEFKVNFLAALPSGVATAHGSVVRLGSRVAVADVRIYGPTGTRLVLSGTFTMLVFPAQHVEMR